MSPDLAALRATPNALARHYTRFGVADRVLLTGHSHQAWPDAAGRGVERAMDDAARLVDGKWPAAFAEADKVGAWYRDRLRDSDGSVTLGGSTHELIVRFLSALDLRRRPRLVTTDGEYHTLRRQLARLAEEGIELVVVSADEPATLAERLAAEVDDGTAAVLASSVLFRSGRIVPGLGRLAAAAARHGAELLVDVYHQLNVVPCNLAADGLDGAFVVGGGYKYCQMGEGVCFLRVPRGRDLRPTITGWFAEFAALTGRTQGVPYGHGADAFAGATYDPISHYRAAAVAEFFTAQGLTPAFLREISQHQVGRLADGFDALDLDPALVRRPAAPLEQLGGFLALDSRHAAALHAGLAERGVSTDYRDRSLRLGPAPYLSDEQLDRGIAALAEVARGISA